jgi:hypothetical protein
MERLGYRWRRAASANSRKYRRAIECARRKPLVFATPAPQAAHLGPDVAELLRKREPTPRPRSQFLVTISRPCHSPMSLVTMIRIAMEGELKSELRGEV